MKEQMIDIIPIISFTFGSIFILTSGFGLLSSKLSILIGVVIFMVSITIGNVLKKKYYS